MTKQIPLHGKYGEGKFTLVDNADFDTLNQYKWYVTNNGYVTRANGSWRVGGSPIAMHREILNPPNDMVIDHIDHDKLNNTRSNLRVVTQRQNTLNSKAIKIASSAYKGVCWNKNKQRWLAKIVIHGKQITIGQFVTQREAAIAYNDAALYHFGEYAHLNDIPLIDPADEPVANRQPPKKSRFRGVYKKSNGKLWYVHIKVNGQIIRVGRFDDEIEAAKTYDELAKKHHGDKAKLNFP